MIENGPTEKAHLHQERQPFTPCNHLGPCETKSGCMCANLDIVCEKTCSCANSCSRKFGGCRCAVKGKVCRENDKCECWALNRECDPELCLACGAHDILDPVNQRRDDIGQGRCANVAIQRGVPKRTILGVSQIMAEAVDKEGLGLYMGEPCRKGDFIDEYVGEIITDAEARRREAVYERRNMSYLFDLNSSKFSRARDDEGPRPAADYTQTKPSIARTWVTSRALSTANSRTAPMYKPKCFFATGYSGLACLLRVPSIQAKSSHSSTGSTLTSFA